MRDFCKALEEHYDSYKPESGFWDLSELRAVPKMIPRHNDYWGRWVYNEKNLTLYYNPEEGKSGYDYEVDLERIHNNQNLVDWLTQLYDKNWTTTEDIGNLFSALYCIFDGLHNTFLHLDNEDFDSTSFLKQRIRDRRVIDAKKTTL